MSMEPRVVISKRPTGRIKTSEKKQRSLNLFRFKRFDNSFI